MRRQAALAKWMRYIAHCASTRCSARSCSATRSRPAERCSCSRDVDAIVRLHWVFESMAHCVMSEHSDDASMCIGTAQNGRTLLHSEASTAQVENALLRSTANLRVLAYHAAISDDIRTANLQVESLSWLDAVTCACWETMRITIAMQTRVHVFCSQRERASDVTGQYQRVGFPAGVPRCTNGRPTQGLDMHGPCLSRH